MRAIHPSYPSATVACACGATYPTRTTRGDFTVDVCGACHPFYTGKQKLMDTAGRVDRFRKKFGDNKVANPKPGKDPAAQSKGVGKKAEKAEKAPEAEKPAT